MHYGVNGIVKCKKTINLYGNCLASKKAPPPKIGRTVRTCLRPALSALYVLLAFSEMALIRDAFSHWADNTCIRFREVPKNQNVTSGNLLIINSKGYAGWFYVAVT